MIPGLKEHFDPDRAEDLIDELREVLGKRRACIIVQNGMMVLCVGAIKGDTWEWRAIAEMDMLTLHGNMKWRPTATPAVKPS